MGQRVEKRALAGVGVADDGDDRHVGTPAPASSLLPLLGERLQLHFEVGDALLRAPAPDLELGFAGSPTPDAAGQAGQRIVFLSEPRKRVLQLGELHLELAVAGLGALRKNVEDELRPVDDLEIGVLHDRRDLRGREVSVENERRRVELHRADDDVVELALAHHELGIDAIAALDDDVDHLDSSGSRELFQLGEALVDVVQ